MGLGAAEWLRLGELTLLTVKSSISNLSFFGFKGFIEFFNEQRTGKD